LQQDDWNIFYRSCGKPKVMRTLFLTFLVGAGLAASLFTDNCEGQVTLAWDAAPGPVANYIVCWGTNSGQYFSTNVYPNTQLSATINNLAYSQVFYFVVAAISTNGQQSPFSNEALYTNGPAPGNNVAGGPPAPPGGSGSNPVGPGSGPATPGSGSGSGSGSSGTTSGASPTNYAQAQILGVPPVVGLSFSNAQATINMTGTVGANVLIQSTGDPTQLDSWTTLTNVALTNAAAVSTNSNGQPQDALDVAFVPASQNYVLPQTNAAIQYYRVIMPNDYPILASTVLPAKGYTPRLILVNMPGILDDCCYVAEASSFIHYTPTNYALQLQGSGSTIRQIATTLANSLNLDWTTASEFSYSNGMGQILATVVETEPASSDPVASQASTNASIVINF
jgi:hypothetical protein